MATTLKPINGAMEHNLEGKATLTVFSGGRGKCVAVHVGLGHKGELKQTTFVHLDMLGAQELRDQLNAILENNYQHLEEF